MAWFFLLNLISHVSSFGHHYGIEIGLIRAVINLSCTDEDGVESILCFRTFQLYLIPAIVQSFATVLSFMLI